MALPVLQTELACFQDKTVVAGGHSQRALQLPGLNIIGSYLPVVYRLQTNGHLNLGMMDENGAMASTDGAEERPLWKQVSSTAIAPVVSSSARRARGCLPPSELHAANACALAKAMSSSLLACMCCPWCEVSSACQ